MEEAQIISDIKALKQNDKNSESSFTTGGEYQPRGSVNCKNKSKVMMWIARTKATDNKILD